MSDDKQSFNLSRFLKDNSELFTLLSVFGAISIYLAQFSAGVNSNWKHIGQVSGLLLFFLVALEIRRNLKSRLDSSLLDFLIKPRKESYRLLLFVVPFYSLVLSIGSVAVQYPSAGTFVGQAILVFVGISNVLWTIMRGASLLGLDDLGMIGRDKKVVTLGKYMFYVSISFAFLSLFAISHIGAKYEYGLTAIQNLRPGPGIVPFLISYLGGIFLGSLFYLSFSGLIFLLYRIIRYIDQMEHRKQFVKSYQAFFGIDESASQTELNNFTEE